MQVAEKTALAPVATRPSSLQPGFWYSFKGSNRPAPTMHRVTRKESCPAGECLVIEADNGAVMTMTADYGLTEMRNRDGSWTRFSPPLASVRWPLRVGDTWSETMTIEQSSGGKQVGQVRVDVVGYESVTVPAGSFMAFKTVVSLGGRRFRETWYAPETRTFVRGVTYDARGDQVVSELVDYQKER